jgi:hypothetical protein
MHETIAGIIPSKNTINRIASSFRFMPNMLASLNLVMLLKQFPQQHCGMPETVKLKFFDRREYLSARCHYPSALLREFF